MSCRFLVNKTLTGNLPGSTSRSHARLILYDFRMRYALFIVATYSNDLIFAKRFSYLVAYDILSVRNTIFCSGNS